MSRRMIIKSRCQDQCATALLRSGGCGAMYEVHIESDEFKGKRTVQQHQLVNQVKYAANNK